MKQFLFKISLLFSEASVISVPNNGYFYADLCWKRVGRLFPFVPTFFRKGCYLLVLAELRLFPFFARKSKLPTIF